MKIMKKYLFILITIAGFSSFVQSQNFYDINTINSIEITFEESNWDYLLDQLVAAGQEERLIGTVVLNGQFFDSVGVRYKGNSTYSPNQVKNPLNIKLDHIIDDQLIEGYGTLKLANCFKDPSFVREVLTYEMARNYMAAGLSNFANVYINGTHLGLYTNDQNVDKHFMRTHFGSDENTRIKGEITSGGGPPTGGVWDYYGEDSTSYYNLYDMKSDYGWEELINFLDTLNNHNNNVDQLLNIDNHLWFIAFSNLLVNLDGPINNPQNYYLYKGDNGRFRPVLWDLNESFGGFRMHQTLGNLNTTQAQQLSPLANLYESEFPIISKILTNDTYRKIYVAHMKTIIEEYFDNNLYETRALQIQDIIDDDVQADQNKFYSYANFISNIYNQVGGGPMGVIGIVQLMDARTDYLNSLQEFQYDGPEISSVSHSPESAAPNNEVWFNASVTNETDVFLSHRTGLYGVFEKIPMFDDGNHEDGQAGDGIYGVSLNTGSTNIQYYIYAENSNAVSFSPARAEYEYYTVEVSGIMVINEFMADNESTVVDQDGEFDDWIEFFNNGNTDISLNGYYLSDDSSEPDQWVFPDTTITAGGYLIVWCDKDDDQSGLHANFKLSASGEVIILSDNDMSVIDEITFTQQYPDTTFGRFVNGTGDFILMLPTFSAENTDLITGLNDVISNNIAFELKQNYPNPFDDYTNIDLIIPETNFVKLNIWNTIGKKVATLVNTRLPAGEHSFNWNRTNIPSGLYFYSITINGKTTYKKMIIR